MKKNNYFVMFFFGLILFFGQSSSAQNTFQKIYEGIGNLQGHTIKQTTDGGYIVAGMTFYNATNDDDLLLVRLNSLGDTLWCKTYGGSQGDYGNSVTVIQTDDDLDGFADNGFLLTGVTKSFGSIDGDFYILKLDQNGAIQWENRVTGTGIDKAQSSWQTTDGGYVIAGSSNSKSVGSSDYYIIRLDLAGNLLWDYAIGGGLADHASSVQQTGDGGYIIAGGTRSFGVSAINASYVVKLTAGGTLDWDRVYDHAEIDQFISIDQTNDGGYAMVGLIQQPNMLNIRDISLVKIDNNGNLKWAKQFGGLDDERGVYLQEANDGGLIVSGYTESYGSGDRDLLLIKTDNNGTVEWSKTYGGAGWESTGLWGETVDQTADNGYVMIGNSNSYPLTNINVLHSLYVIKTDSNGVSGCNEVDFTIDEVVPVFNEFTPNSAPSGSLLYVTQTSTIKPLPIERIDTLCSFIPEEPEPELCDSCGRKKNKVLICHRHGNHGHTRCISQNALAAHLAHGDNCGPCENEGHHGHGHGHGGDGGHGGGRMTTDPNNSSQSNSSGFNFAQTIYPNPFTSIININVAAYQLGSEETITVNVYDMMGRNLRQIQISGQSKFELDLSDLINGIYIYDIRTSKELLETGKIVKE